MLIEYVDACATSDTGARTSCFTSAVEDQERALLESGPEEAARHVARMVIDEVHMRNAYAELSPQVPPRSEQTHPSGVTLVAPPNDGSSAPQELCTRRRIGQTRSDN